jgi:hypothetical protein
LCEVRDAKRLSQQRGNEDRGRDIGEAHDISLELGAFWLCRLAFETGGMIDLRIFCARNNMNARVASSMDQLLRK